jgi:hypothetical protein
MAQSLYKHPLSNKHSQTNQRNFFMKQLFVAAALLVSATSFAATGIHNYVVTESKFAPSHVAHPGHGVVTLNYDNSTIKLVVEKVTPCTPGGLCSQVKLAPLTAELTITSIETDSCGIHRVIAKHDMRPVDGQLEQITVIDPSEMTCKTFVAVLPEATYLTTFVNRRTGKDVTDTSKMTLQETSKMTFTAQ